MYINDTHIMYYAVVAILGLFVGMFVDWMNSRLPEYKKVFTKEIKEYLTIEEIKVYELKKEGRSNSDISKILDKPYKNITNTISRIKCKLISLD